MRCAPALLYSENGRIYFSLHKEGASALKITFFDTKPYDRQAFETAAGREDM